MSPFIVCKRRDVFQYAVYGETYPLNGLYKQVPGLGWDKVKQQVTGRGDAVRIYLDRAENDYGYTIQGERPALPKSPPPALVGGMHPMQQETVAWASSQGFDGAIIAHPMGAGKTWCSLEAARKALGVNARKAVVCPAFLRMNWAAEIEKRNLGTYQVCSSSQPPTGGSEWTIVSYEGLERGLLDEHTYEGVIFDEAHYVKNHYKAKRAKAACAFAKRTRWRCALTGTPVWNRRRDLWGVAEVVRPGALGHFLGFANRYLLARQGSFGLDLDGPYPEDPDYESVTEELRARLAWFYTRSDGIVRALTGGSPQRLVHWCAPPAGLNRIDYGAFSGLDAAREINSALRQTARAKLKPAAELAAQATEAGDRFIAWTFTRDGCRELAELLGVPGISGELAADERVDALRKAADTGGRGVVATMDSLGMGVNAQWANVSIFADLDWVPTKMAQCMGRIDRPGQTKPTRHYFLACKGTLDEAVVGTLIQKTEQYTGLFDDSDVRGLRDALGRVEEEPDALSALLAKLSASEPTQLDEHDE